MGRKKARENAFKCIFQLGFENEYNIENMINKSLFIQVSDHLGLDEEEFSVDYENLLNISRSTARYLTAELVNGTMIIKAYNEKKEALMAIMSSKTLNSSNLITRY